MNNRLRQLYESTEEDLIYGVGIIQLTDAGPTPFTHIHYRDWSRKKLEAVRESFQGGLVLVSAERKPGQHHLYIGTRDWFGIHQAESENTPAFRPAAWDAHLPDVKDRAFQSFDANPQRYGGFLLLVQTPEWEFLTGVDDVEDRTIVGAILPRSMPGPPGNKVG